MAKLIPVTFNAEQHARTETERKNRLFEWADRVLDELGYTDRIARAQSSDELRKIIFDASAVEVTLAIREALHPVVGGKRNHFAGLNDEGLRKVLRKRFNEQKKSRDEELRRSGSSRDRRRSNFDWTQQLILDDKGAVLPLLSNLVQLLRYHPEWEGVLAYNEFAVSVVARKSPPWGKEEPDAPWGDYFDSLCRIWFQSEDIFATVSDVGRGVQVAARSNPFHPVREYLSALVWDGTPRIDRWLITYAHADDTEYARAVGPR